MELEIYILTQIREWVKAGAWGFVPAKPLCLIVAFDLYYVTDTQFFYRQQYMMDLALRASEV